MSKLYPSVPTDYRLDQVRSLQSELLTEVRKRERLLKRSKRTRFALARSSEALSIFVVGLGSASVGLMATGVGLPFAIPTAALGILVGLVELGLSPARTRAEKKARRHTLLRALAESRHITTSRLLSKGLADGVLSDAEYQAFLDERESWIKARDEINSSTESQMKDLALEFRARLAEIGHRK